MKKTFFILMSIVMMIALSSCSNDDSIVVGSDYGHENEVSKVLCA